jgi:hypothetical protein
MYLSLYFTNNSLLKESDSNAISIVIQPKKLELLEKLKLYILSSLIIGKHNLLKKTIGSKNNELNSLRASSNSNLKIGIRRIAFFILRK